MTFFTNATTAKWGLHDVVSGTNLTTHEPHSCNHNDSPVCMQRQQAMSRDLPLAQLARPWHASCPALAMPCLCAYHNSMSKLACIMLAHWPCATVREAESALGTLMSNLLHAYVSWVMHYGPAVNRSPICRDNISWSYARRLRLLDSSCLEAVVQGRHCR